MDWFSLEDFVSIAFFVCTWNVIGENHWYTFDFISSNILIGRKILRNCLFNLVELLLSNDRRILLALILTYYNRNHCLFGLLWLSEKKNAPKSFILISVIGLQPVFLIEWSYYCFHAFCDLFRLLRYDLYTVRPANIHDTFTHGTLVKSSDDFSLLSNTSKFSTNCKLHFVSVSMNIITIAFYDILERTYGQFDSFLPFEMNITIPSCGILLMTLNLILKILAKLCQHLISKPSLLLFNLFRIAELLVRCNPLFNRYLHFFQYVFIGHLFGYLLLSLEAFK